MKEKTRNSGSSLMKSTIILVIASFAVKAIGAIFKIPLANLIGKEGMGLFGYAYQIYTFMFIIATAGFPIAVSKMVAESRARGNLKDANRVFQTALLLLGFVGIIGSTVLFVFAKQFAQLLGSPDAYLGMLAISPSIFFVSLVSAYRGFFQGNQNMYPTAISEITEAGAKLLIGFFAAKYVVDMTVNPELTVPIDFASKAIASTKNVLQYSSAGAVLGVTSGTFLALVVIMIIYQFTRKKSPVLQNEYARSRKRIAKELILIAIPITIGASVSSLTGLIDLATITRRLIVNPDVFTPYAHVFADGTPFAKDVLEHIPAYTAVELLEKKATALWGMYNGFAIPMFNLPLTIVVALSMSVVPAIAGVMASERVKEARKMTQSVIRITLLFALPCALGMSVLSKPILGILYHDTDAYLVLQKLAIAIVSVSLVSVTNAMLQAYGRVYVPLVTMLVGGVVKVLMNYFLIPVWGIDVAPISTNVCYAIIMIMNLYYLAKHINLSFNIVTTFLSPVISAVIMAVSALFAYEFLEKIISGKLSVMLAICAAAVVYLVLIFITRAITREDLEMLPMGKKIADKLVGKRAEI